MPRELKDIINKELLQTLYEHKENKVMDISLEIRSVQDSFDRFVSGAKETNYEQKDVKEAIHSYLGYLGHSKILFEHFNKNNLYQSEIELINSDTKFWTEQL